MASHEFTWKGAIANTATVVLIVVVALPAVRKTREVAFQEDAA